MWINLRSLHLFWEWNPQTHEPFIINVPAMPQTLCYRLHKWYALYSKKQHNEPGITCGTIYQWKHHCWENGVSQGHTASWWQSDLNPDLSVSRATLRYTHHSLSAHKNHLEALWKLESHSWRLWFWSRKSGMRLSILHLKKCALCR